jgi:hypothetical protein
MAYSAPIPAFVQRTAADGLAVGNTVILNSTGNNNPIAIMSEMKGGLHLVEYLEYLSENSYRGVSIARREVGMLAYVQREWRNGADLALGKYYSLISLAGNGDATWQEMSFGGGNTVTPNETFPVATIAQRDALPDLVMGDIVIVADASGDASVVPALEGGATYIYTGDAGQPWLRFLYPADPRLNDSHKQNTDTAFKVVLGGGMGDVIMQTRTVYDHINDASIHFKINDGNDAGSLTEVYSSRKLRSTFIAKNPQGSATKFFNELGDAVEIQVDFNLTKINGGNASTQY